MSSWSHTENLSFCIIKMFTIFAFPLENVWFLSSPWGSWTRGVVYRAWRHVGRFCQNWRRQMFCPHKGEHMLFVLRWNREREREMRKREGGREREEFKMRTQTPHLMKSVHILTRILLGLSTQSPCPLLLSLWKKIQYISVVNMIIVITLRSAVWNWKTNKSVKVQEEIFLVQLNSVNPYFFVINVHIYKVKSYD